MSERDRHENRPVLITAYDHVARMFCRHKGWSPNREAIIITGARDIQRLRGQHRNKVYRLPGWLNIPHRDREEIAAVLSTMDTGGHIEVGEAPQWLEA